MRNEAVVILAALQLVAWSRHYKGAQGSGASKDILPFCHVPGLTGGPDAYAFWLWKYSKY
jgi:hypothetical protein